MEKFNKVIIVSGPTASGKTKLSLELAQKYSAEIVNFDSLLFYREISVGTAKPTQAELSRVPHHMINNHSIFDPINAAGYFKQALPIVKKILATRKLVVLVGGSGFYLQALLNGMFESTTTSEEVQSRSDLLYQSQGIEPFLKILQEHDEASFERYHENDHYRIRRAVEHFWETKKPFSSARNQMGSQAAPKDHWDILHLYLDIPKEEHFKIIQTRTKQIIADGLLEEVKQLQEMGATGQEKPLQSIGYLESFDYLAGKYASLEEYEERINISTRQLAKAQRTWFKKQEKNSYNPLEDWDKILQKADEFIYGNL